MRKIEIFLVLVFTAFTAAAQWPTSTRTDSALSINYGFDVKAVTFDDGSVIFSHGYSRYQFLTKFDARGYAAWFNPVLINNHDSAAGGTLNMVSDGAKGVIVVLGDKRGVTYDSMGIARANPIWMQRVDSNGTELWGASGVQAAPNDRSAKFAWLTTDGAGGAVLVTLESSWWWPGALNNSRLRARRINSRGQVLWIQTLDSTADVRLLFNLNKVSRAGKFVYIDGYRYYQPSSETNLTRIIDTSGNVPSYSPWFQYYNSEVWKDSVLFIASGQQVLKIGSDGDTVWSVTVPFAQGTGCRWLSAWKAIVPEKRGGLYWLKVCNDSLYYVTARGQLSRLRFPGISNPNLSPNTIGVFSDASGGLVWADIGGLAQRYDSLGRYVWGASPIVYRSDPENAYFSAFWQDNNGGIIATFWSTSRGLCAQHTGRYGRAGIVPVIQQRSSPDQFVLNQNFPNPFNPTTKIRYAVASRQEISIEIFDLLGREVERLVRELKEPGSYEIEWNADGIASGVYVYRMKAGGNVIAVKKMMLIR